MPPTTTFDGTMTYHYGDNIVELLPMVPAHTYGDIVVYLPQHQVLFVGDIGFFYVVPWCQNAHPSHWIEVYNQIDAMTVQVVVPGHGPLGGKPELADMRDYLVRLKAETRRRYDARMTAGAAAAEIRMGKYDNWIGPERMSWTCSGSTTSSRVRSGPTSTDPASPRRPRHTTPPDGLRGDGARLRLLAPFPLPEVRDEQFAETLGRLLGDPVADPTSSPSRVLKNSGERRFCEYQCG